MSESLPNTSSHDVVTFDINIDGSPLDPTVEVLSIDISKEINRIPSARLSFIDGDAAEENFALSSSDNLIPGKEIQIKLGRDSKNETVFKGIILKHSIKVTSGGASLLVIECRDSAVKMTIGRHSKYYEEKKDSEVIEELIGNYGGLSKDVEATNIKHKELVQYHCTDWDFMLSRADTNGKLVIVDDGKIQVKKPDIGQSPKLNLLYGSSIFEFEGELDARSQWKKVKAQAWDYAKQDMFSSDADSATFAEPGNLDGKKLSDTIGLKEFELRHSGHVLVEELTEWAKSAMLKSRMAQFRGRAKIIVGQANIKPGDVVELKGLGNRFNGNAYVTAIRHEVTSGTWDTHLQFGLSPDWFASREEIIDFPASGLLPAMRGLQIGKVVQLEKDPDGEDRILVKLPIIDPAAQGVWARVACLDAGKQRGTFFRPEIDDEVIVGFINDDPRDPVVLGQLNSSNKPAPLQAKDDNHEKGIFTRSKMRVLFNDDTKTITIDTPSKNSIVIDEKSKSIVITDQNKNTIKMETAGITIDSPKNINIKAGANISIEAKANFNVKAAQIGEKAQGPIKLEGALATLSSQGITEVKGSLVKIN